MRQYMTPFTLVTMFPLVMYALCQADLVHKRVTEVQLDKDIARYLADHPGASQQQIYAHVARHSVPSSVPGSPSWHYQHLQDLKAYVHEYGMPSFFLTLTSDDITEDKWPEVRIMEDDVHRVYDDATFQDIPVECARLFHARVTEFMNDNILDRTRTSRSSKLLGRVQHHLVKYELQGRHSLHAHIVLWVHPDDIDEIADEIMAYSPGPLGSDGQPDLSGCDDETCRLADLVNRKQMHVCRENGCRAKYGYCRYGFPYPVQVRALLVCAMADTLTTLHKSYPPATSPRDRTSCS
jgi:hypothetical protein